MNFRCNLLVAIYMNMFHVFSSKFATETKALLFTAQPQRYAHVICRNFSFPVARVESTVFHQAFFGHVGVDDAIQFALGVFQILFSSTKILNF